MKSKEELCALKEEGETVGKKLAELTDEELAQVAGGVGPVLPAVYDMNGEILHLYDWVFIFSPAKCDKNSSYGIIIDCNDNRLTVELYIRPDSRSPQVSTGETVTVSPNQVTRSKPLGA